MKKVFALIAMVALVFAVNAQAASSNDWGTNYTGMQLNVERVNIHLATDYAGSFKQNGNNTLGGPGTGTGPSNFAMDAYTAPTWATTAPSVFSTEDYTFSGGSAATVSHRVIFCNNAGPWPTPLSLGFAWQPCGAGVIFPPMPSLLGTTIDGGTIALTLPPSGTPPGGIWYITIGISGFSADEYDWGWLSRTDGVTPLPVPAGLAVTDMGGIGPGPGYVLMNSADAIGNGKGSGRPWCFDVNP